MALPEGARSVRYDISITNLDGPELYIQFECGFTETHAGERDNLDAAIEAGADAMISLLESQYPSQTVNAQRRYEMSAIPGEPWPA